MIDIREVEGGVVVPIKVQPGARQTTIAGLHAGMLKVSVKAKPQQGKANAAVLELLADKLDIAKSACWFVHGKTQRQKLIFIQNLSADDVRRRLGIG